LASKLRIKIGNVEFEYEGDAEFSHESIKDLFTHMEDLSNSAADTSAQPPADSLPSQNSESKSPSIHTASIAARLTAKSATDLALASAAHLQIVLGRDVFNRQELLDDMKTAPAFFKASMNNNHSKTIATLVGNQSFNQVSGTTYSLTVAKRSELEKFVVE